jgi:hypothetical protein
MLKNLPTVAIIVLVTANTASPGFMFKIDLLRPLKLL